ncbi:MAG: hypothetical protein HQL60_01485, partial [Magnetococcales bacterium]|nr:hypothetical protein [Magnetococcales bacterium]
MSISAIETEKDEYDGPWKDIIETYFEDFIAFYMPEAHKQIDWSRYYEFLDKEMERIIRKSAVGKRILDKLVKVWLKNGNDIQILIHIEVYGNRKTNVAEIMYQYMSYSYLRYHQLITGLAILADDDESWQPSPEFGYSLFGTKLSYQFNLIKLLDYLKDADALEQMDNPFAVVTLAQLKAKETRLDPQLRYQAKW